MKHLAVLFLAAGSLLTVTGCYSSPVPLGSPSEAQVDSSWVGEWVAAGDSTASEGRLRLFAFNGQELLAEVSADTVVADIVFEWNREHFRAFPSEVEGVLFANVQPIDFGEDRDYFFYRVDLRSDTMMLQAVSGELFREGGWIGGTEVKFSDPAELRAYVAERLGDPKLYEEDRMVFVKVREREE